MSAIFDSVGYFIVGASVGLSAYAMTPEGTQALFGWVKPVEEFLGVEKARAPSPGMCVTSVLCLGAVVLTVLHIIGHLRNYRRPAQQRYIIRIMLMVPIYAIDSLLGFAFHRRAEELSLLRDTYEAYVLYNFFHLLMDFVGGEDGTVAMWEKFNGKDATMAHAFPMNHVWAPFKLNRSTVNTWRFMLVQYMVLSPVFTFSSYFGIWAGHELEETISWAVMVVRNLSVTCAFTALMYFYLCSKKLTPMKPHHPTGKFIAVKLVIALSFWQYLGLAQVASHNLFPTGTRRFLFTWAPHRQTPEAAEQALENLLTVAEMLLTAVLHHNVYSHREFSESSLREIAVAKGDAQVVSVDSYSFPRAVAHAFSVGDVFAETKQSTKSYAKKSNASRSESATSAASALDGGVEEVVRKSSASAAPKTSQSPKRRSKKED